MIYNWQFRKGRVAFSSGPTHGDYVPNYELHDVKTGRLVAQWRGKDAESVPSWARRFWIEENSKY